MVECLEVYLYDEVFLKVCDKVDKKKEKVE